MIKKHRRFYSSIEEASESAQSLGFKNRLEYVAGYSSDSKLPRSPKALYQDSWIDWNNFLGLVNYYSFEKASQVAKEFGFLTSAQYRSERHKDSRLPSKPERTYENDWKGWKLFLGTRDSQYYPSLSEASNVAQSLGFSSMDEYGVGCKKDSRLPITPQLVYREEWQGAKKYLGKGDKNFYANLSKASEAAQTLNFSNRTEYELGYKKDNRLPSSPEKMYLNEWQGWDLFLGKPKRDYYPTLHEASNAAIRLGFKNHKEYKAGYIKDTRLPLSPWSKYQHEWKGMDSFLGKKKIRIYGSLEEASQAAQQLGLASMVKYKADRKRDPRLPADPSQVYKNEWKGAAHFLNIKSTKLYSSLIK